MYLVITDFEATCWHRDEMSAEDLAKRLRTQEIIEIGSILVAPNTLEVIHKMSFTIKPIFDPVLSSFCKDLTGIDQEMVDFGVPFGIALKSWTAMLSGRDDIFCSWGAFDRNILEKNCRLHRVEYPFSTLHVNLKNLVAEVSFDGKRAGVAQRCKDFGIEFEGQQHRALIDAENILCILREMCAQQCTSFGEILAQNGVKV